MSATTPPRPQPTAPVRRHADLPAPAADALTTLVRLLARLAARDAFESETGGQAMADDPTAEERP